MEKLPMSWGEIVQLLVSVTSALICLYIKSCLAELRGELLEKIHALEIQNIRADNRTRTWVQRNFRPLTHQSLLDESEA